VNATPRGAAQSAATITHTFWTGQQPARQEVAVTQVVETKLPGVGVRHDFVTTSGQRIGVIVHHAGDRELLIYDDRDPDRCRESLRVEEHEAHTLAEMLGAAQVHRASTDALQQVVEGMAIDWLTIPSGSPAAGRTIRQLALRQRTGATIVAIVRGEQTIPSPGPDELLEVGDTAVVAGAPEAVARAFDELRHP
jgi:TrkA domain protein